MLVHESALAPTVASARIPIIPEVEGRRYDVAERGGDQRVNRMAELGRPQFYAVGS